MMSLGFTFGIRSPLRGSATPLGSFRRRLAMILVPSPNFVSGRARALRPHTLTLLAAGRKPSGPARNYQTDVGFI